MNRLCLLLSVCIVWPCTVAAPSLARSAEPGNEWVLSHPFQISTCYLFDQRPMSGAYKSCGMNAVHIWYPNYYPALVTNAKSAELKIHYQLNAQTLTLSEITNLVTANTTATDDSGFYIIDEPDSSLFGSIAQVGNWLKQNRPNGLIYLNLNKTESSYLDPMMDTIHPDIIMWDAYPFKSGGSIDWDKHFGKMMAFRAKAIASNVPYFDWMASFGEGSSYRAPSESELRMEMFSSLACGVKGLAYFTYDSQNTNFDVALMDKNGNPSYLYTVAQNANAEIARLGKVLRYLQSVDARFIPGKHSVLGFDVENSTPSGLADWHAGAGGISEITDVKVASGQSGSTKNGLIGFFTDSLGRKYFMLCNLHCGSSLTSAQANLELVVTFDGSVNQLTRLSRTTGLPETVALSNHVLDITLSGGTGDLFCMTSNVFDGAAPTGSLLINGGATYTLDNTVALTPSATDNQTVSQMRFSNDMLNWTAWETYATTPKPWTLTAGMGSRTVYAQFRDDVGLISQTCSDTIIVTDDFTPPAGSVAINSGSAYTRSASVTLTITASDPETAVTDVRFSNDNVTWSVWEPYAGSKTWSLAAGDGTRTVYVQVRNSSGLVSDSFSESIVMDATAPTASVKVDGDAAYCTSASVSLSLSATDDVSGVSLMRFSNDNANWSAWQAYTTSTPWTLTPASGWVTVYAQFQDNAGNIRSTFDRITRGNPVGIPQAKEAGTNVTVVIAGKVVTAVLSNGQYVYVAEPDGSAGIRVAGGMDVHIGDVVDIGGYASTTGGEKLMYVYTYQVRGVRNLRPLGMPLKSVGGGDWHYNPSTYAGQEGITGMSGINNIGALVRVWGLVKPGSTAPFCLDDGSGSLDVILLIGLTPPTVGRYAAITGISWCWKDGALLRRRLLVTRQSDIVQF